MTLDVLICTYGPQGPARVERMNLPAVEGVRYIVSWQEHDGLPLPPSLAERPDVEVHRLDLRGLSNNRNNAMDHSRADIRLIADDDLVYTPAQLRAVIDTFERNPQVDIATFMYEGSDSKTYPAEECSLDKFPRNFFISSIEIAIRADSPAGRMRLDPDFGLGSQRFTLGEDELFILEARHRGLDVRFFPIVITRHEGVSTGLRRMTDPRALAGTGAVIYFSYPLTAMLRIPLKAWRMARAGQASFIPALWHGMRGALTAAFLLTPPWKRK